MKLDVARFELNQLIFADDVLMPGLKVIAFVFDYVWLSLWKEKDRSECKK